MGTARLVGAGLLIAAATVARPQVARSNDKPTESEHQRGPHGLEGWTLNWPDPDNPDERLPTTLVVAREGRVLQRIDGDGMVWRWIFWADGAQVAYEAGPKHFGLACVLFDLKKGREISRVDCYHGLPPSPPAWLKALESDR